MLNRFVVGLGVLVLIIGGLTHFLLISLSNEVFRGNIAFYQNIALLTIIVGVVVSFTGFGLRPFKSEWLDSRLAGKYFGYSALINAIAAALFTVPLFYPPLDFPILITEWPGIYMIIAYSFFIIFGVLGMIAWSYYYSNFSPIVSRENFSRPIVILQLLLSNIGVYGMSISLFLGGYIGAYLAYIGAGSIIVGANMEFSDIPSAISISFCIVSVFLGVSNFLRGK